MKSHCRGIFPQLGADVCWRVGLNNPAWKTWERSIFGLGGVYATTQEFILPPTKWDPSPLPYLMSVDGASMMEIHSNASLLACSVLAYFSCVVPENTARGGLIHDSTLQTHWNSTLHQLLPSLHHLISPLGPHTRHFLTPHM